MVYAANDLAVILNNNWSLTGTVSKTATDTMKEPVWIFGHPKVGGLDYTKLVYVYKINVPEAENQVQHPKWTEYRDVYKIVCEYRVIGTDDTDFDAAESDIQAMCVEVQRILMLTYNPAAATGQFFNIHQDWTVEDQFTGDQAQLVRVLVFTGISIRPTNTDVVRGFNGVLLFDITNSQGVNLPVTNYSYTEVWDIQIGPMGYSVIPEYISFATGSTVPRAVPVLYRGVFNGSFRAKITAKGTDVGATNTNAINQIWQLFTNNELPRVFLIWTSTSQVGKTLTISTPIYITGFTHSGNVEDVSEHVIEGRIYKPSTFTYA